MPFLWLLAQVSRSASQRSARSPGMKQYSPPRLTTKAGSPLRWRRIGCFGMVNSWPPLLLTSGSFSAGAPMNLPSFAHSLWMNSNCRSRCAPTKANMRPRVVAVVLHYSRGQRLAIVGAAPDHAVQAHFANDDRVAGVHPSDMRADRGLEAMRVVAEHEGVVAFWVGPKFGIVLLWSQCQRRPAAPAPNDLGGQPLLLGAVLGVLAQILAEGGYARVQLAEDRVGAVAAQHLGLRDWGDVVELILVPQDELTGLERRFVRIGAGNARYPRRPDGRCHPRNRTCYEGRRQRVRAVAR